jgi:hypothetical protein
MFFELWEMYFTIIINKTLNNCYAFKVIYLYQCFFFSFFNFYFILWKWHIYAEKIYIAYLGGEKKNNVFSLRSFIKNFHKQGYWKMLDQTHLWKAWSYGRIFYFLNLIFFKLFNILKNNNLFVGCVDYFRHTLFVSVNKNLKFIYTITKNKSQVSIC